MLAELRERAGCRSSVSAGGYHTTFINTEGWLVTCGSEETEGTTGLAPRGRAGRRPTCRTGTPPGRTRSRPRGRPASRAP
eukprot:2277319-Prymnesium_polylepis.1